ncbi:hypothetical protein ACFWIB_43140, partial [Streptomyces sp. NPDC127051]
TPAPAPTDISSTDTGTSVGGTCVGGTWLGGTCVGGTWLGGTCVGGTCVGGTWLGGTCVGGTWLGGTCVGGTWLGGTCVGGTCVLHGLHVLHGLQVVRHELQATHAFSRFGCTLDLHVPHIAAGISDRTLFCHFSCAAEEIQRLDRGCSA